MWKIIFIANLASTLYLTGVIWLVQLVQYPFFAQVGAENFSKYHASHSFWITPVVAPAMILELLTSVFLILYPPENIDVKLIWLGLILAVTLWISTFFLQVPMHEKLAQGFNAEAHRFLVNSNWIRTVAWTLRSGLVCYFLWKLIRP
jgi:uncharacterized membrane protein